MPTRTFIASENTLKSKSLNNVTMKDKGFISTASKMKKWLDAAWKQDGDIKLESAISITSFAKLVGNKKGIYLMLAENQTDFGASGHVTFWSNKTKNPWIIAAGTTATYIGVATTAMVMVLGGVEPKDMVIEFPQKENRTFGGVYTNDYRNKKSLENTPDWGTKN